MMVGVEELRSKLRSGEDSYTGIPRVIRLMREHNGSEPEFELIGEEFVARLRSTFA